MSNRNVIWAEFAGNGFVAGPFPSSVITTVAQPYSGVYEITMLWTDIYGPPVSTQRMINNIGARVWVEGYTARQLPNGYYYIKSATTTTVTIIAELDNTPTTGAGSSASIRIEDFYRICNAVPDFVTGQSARLRWLEAIPQDGISPTLGQKIEAKGGMASFDGLSLSMIFPNAISEAVAPPWDTTTSPIGIDLYLTQEAYKRNFRAFYPTATVSGTTTTAILNSDITPTATTMRISGTTALAPQHVSAGSTVLFEYTPVFLDREAILVESNVAAGADYYEMNIARGLLDTGFHPTGSSHVRNSSIYDGLQTGQSAIVRIRQMGDDYLTPDLDADGNSVSNLIYTGMVEDVSFSNNTSEIKFELSPQIFGSGKQTWKAKLTSDGTLISNEYDPTGVSELTLRIPEFPEPEYPWNWIEYEDIALRVRDPRTLQKNTFETDNGNGSFSIETAVDHIFFDPTPANRQYNNNYVILKEAETDVEFFQLGRSRPRTVDPEDSIEDPERKSKLAVQDPVDGLLTRDDVLNTGVIRMDLTVPKSTKVSPCHVFEYSAIPSLFDITADETFATPSYVAYINLNELILQILTSNNGDGANGVFDVLPKGMGLAINKNDIDYPSFAWDFDNSEVDVSLLADKSASYKILAGLKNVYAKSSDLSKINDWLSKNVLEPFNLALIQNDEGKVSLIDMTFFEALSGASQDTLSDADLEYEFGTKNFTFNQRYDASQVFDRITFETVDVTVNPVDVGQKTTIITVPTEKPDTATGVAGNGPRLYTQLSAQPLSFSIPYAVASGVDTIKEATSTFASLYSKILPTIEFTASSQTGAGNNGFELGQKIAINLSTVVNPSGGRGITGFGIIIDKRRNILARQAVYTAIILGNEYPFLDTGVWTASGELTGASSGTDIIIQNNVYTPASGTEIGWDTDEDGFEVDDWILLYDENFVLLSVDGSNNADPRKINSIIPQVSTVKLTISSAFTDSGGAAITLAAGQIITHAEKSLQTLSTQSANEWIRD